MMAKTIVAVTLLCLEMRVLATVNPPRILQQASSQTCLNAYGSWIDPPSNVYKQMDASTSPNPNYQVLDFYLASQAPGSTTPNLWAMINQNMATDCQGILKFKFYDPASLTSTNCLTATSLSQDCKTLLGTTTELDVITGLLNYDDSIKNLKVNTVAEASQEVVLWAYYEGTGARKYFTTLTRFTVSVINCVVQNPCGINGQSACQDQRITITAASNTPWTFFAGFGSFFATAPACTTTYTLLDSSGANFSSSTTTNVWTFVTSTGALSATLNEAEVAQVKVRIDQAGVVFTTNVITLTVCVPNDLCGTGTVTACSDQTYTMSTGVTQTLFTDWAAFVQTSQALSCSTTYRLLDASNSMITGTTTNGNSLTIDSSSGKVTVGLDTPEVFQFRVEFSQEGTVSTTNLIKVTIAQAQTGCSSLTLSLQPVPNYVDLVDTANSPSVVPFLAVGSYNNLGTCATNYTLLEMPAGSLYTGNQVILNTNHSVDIDKSILGTGTYQIAFEFGGQTYKTNSFLVDISCDGINQSNLATTALTLNFTMNQASAQLALDDLACPYSVCCDLAPVYTLSEQSDFNIFSQSASFGTPTKDPTTGKIVSTVDVSADGSYTVYLHKHDSSRIRLVSVPMVVTVNYDCLVDSATISGLTYGAGESIDATKVPFNASTIPHMLISVANSTNENFSFNILKRIAMTSSGKCPISDVIVSSVKDHKNALVNQQNVVTVTSSGDMNVQNLNTNFTYDVFLKVQNGRIWLDINQPLIRIICTVPPAINSTTTPVFVPPINLTTPPVANTAPQFESELSQVSFDLAKVSGPQEVALPTRTDQENDSIEILVDSSLSYVTFDSDKNALVIDIDSIPEEQKNSVAEVNIILKDAKDQTSYTQRIEFTFKQEQKKQASSGAGPSLNFIPKTQVSGPNFNPTFNTEEQPQKEEPEFVPDTTPNLTASISGLSIIGQLRMQFSGLMPVEDYNLTDYNSSLIQIYVNPTDEDADPKLLNLTWNVTKFENDKKNFKAIMDIQLQFENPSAVSPKVDNFDQLVVYFKKNDSELLLSPSLNKYLHETSRLLKVNIPSQTSMSNTVENFLEASDSQQLTLIFALTFVFIFASLFEIGRGLKYFLWYLRSLQMIIHLPLCRIKVSPIVQSYMKSLIPIIQFDILESLQVSEQVLQFDEVKEAELQKYIIDQMEDIGYESNNAIKNLGSLWIFILFYFMQVIVNLTVLFLFKCVCKKKKIKTGKKLFKKWTRRLYFFNILELLCDGYMEYSIAAFLNISYPIMTEIGEQLGRLTAFVCLVLCCGFVPLTLIYMLIKPIKKLKKREFKRYFGFYLENIRTHSRLQASYYHIYVLRRMIFCATVFWLENPSIQLGLLCNMNLLILIYTGMKPFNEHFFNKLAFLEELVIILAHTLMLSFTEMVNDVPINASVLSEEIDNLKTKDFYGWMFISIIAIHLGTHVLILTLNLFFGIFLVIKKYYLLIEDKFYSWYFAKLSEFILKDMTPEEIDQLTTEQRIALGLPDKSLRNQAQSQVPFLFRKDETSNKRKSLKEKVQEALKKQQKDFNRTAIKKQAKKNSRMKKQERSQSARRSLTQKDLKKDLKKIIPDQPNTSNQQIRKSKSIKDPSSSKDKLNQNTSSFMSIGESLSISKTQDSIEPVEVQVPTLADQVKAAQNDLKDEVIQNHIRKLVSLSKKYMDEPIRPVAINQNELVIHNDYLIGEMPKPTAELNRFQSGSLGLASQAGRPQAKDAVFSFRNLNNSILSGLESNAHFNQTNDSLQQATDLFNNRHSLLKQQTLGLERQLPLIVKEPIQSFQDDNFKPMTYSQAKGKGVGALVMVQLYHQKYSGASLLKFAMQSPEFYGYDTQDEKTRINEILQQLNLTANRKINNQFGMPQEIKNIKSQVLGYQVGEKTAQQPVAKTAPQLAAKTAPQPVAKPESKSQNARKPAQPQSQIKKVVKKPLMPKPKQTSPDKKKSPVKNNSGAKKLVTPRFAK